MAEQVCPKCKNEHFNWSVDDEAMSFISHWRCCSCYYEATEDGRLMLICKKCSKKSESELQGETGVYWWCFSGNTITL